MLTGVAEMVRGMGHSYPRLEFEMRSPVAPVDCPRFLQNFAGILGNPSTTQAAPFLTANRG